jgi:hypothetical protein
MMSGTVVQILILVIITSRYDWEREVSFWFLLVCLAITDNRTRNANNGMVAILFVGTESANSC